MSILLLKHSKLIYAIRSQESGKGWGGPPMVMVILCLFISVLVTLYYMHILL